jgi:hypothetical protein
MSFTLPDLEPVTDPGAASGTGEALRERLHGGLRAALRSRDMVAAAGLGAAEAQRRGLTGAEVGQIVDAEIAGLRR